MCNGNEIYYTLEKCQEILDNKNSTYKAIEIIRSDSRYDDVCVVECPHGKKEIKCTYFYKLNFVCLKCRHEKRDNLKIEKCKILLEENSFKFYKFEWCGEKMHERKFYVHFHDNLGYYYVSKYKNLKNNIFKKLEIVNRISPYNLQNIKNWLLINKSNIEILSDKYIGNTDILKVKCKLCENEYDSYWSNIYHGNECPKCGAPRGEIKIKDFLMLNKIDFVHEKKFDDLHGVNKGKLSYDFYLDKKSVVIEFNGQQHYEPIKYFGGKKTFEKQLKHDELKRKYAETSNIKLIIIPYWEFDNIEEILKKELNIS